MLPPQTGLKLIFFLEWSTFGTLMMTMKWLWYCATMIVLEIPRPSILRFEHPLAAIKASTVHLKFSSVTACVVVKCVSSWAKHIPHIGHLCGSSTSFSVASLLHCVHKLIHAASRSFPFFRFSYVIPQWAFSFSNEYSAWDLKSCTLLSLCKVPPHRIQCTVAV